MHLRLLFAALAISPCLLRAQLGDKLSEGPEVPLPVARHFTPSPAQSAEAELRSFQLPPGFRIELVAAEPLVHDPVAAAYDADGNLWVAEMSHFNAGMIHDQPVLTAGVTTADSSKIVKLESSRHDGHYDRRTVWLDQDLVLPRGIMFVRDGVLIADPPRLWLARDRHGVGHCDEKELAADNFGVIAAVEESGSLLWGRDNVIHDVSFAYDYRYDHGRLHRLPVQVRGQFGITQDDFGRLYFTLNSDQLRCDLYAPRYSVRNPHVTELPWSNVRIAQDQEVWPSHPTPAVNRGYHPGELGKSTGGLRPDGTLLEFTAACSSLIYRGENFPSRFRGNAFVPEPSANLIKRSILLEAEGRITAVNAYEGREFLTSTDTRFRPVSLLNAPDGSILAVDLYHGLLEDYHFVTSYLRDQTLGKGLDKPFSGLGRIWRITYEGGPLEKTTPHLGQLDGPGLAALLRHPNAWWRDNAQEMLVQRGGQDAVPALEKMALEEPAPATRVYALWTLDGLGAVSRPLLARALRDPSAKVRSAAVRLHERWLGGPDEEETLQQLETVAADPAPEVSVQLALSLGEAKGPAGLALMDRVLGSSGDHPFVPAAIASGLRGREYDFLAGHCPEWSEMGRRPELASMIRLLSTAVVRQGNESEVRRLVSLAGDGGGLPGWSRLAVLDGFEPLLRPAFRRSVAPGWVADAASLAPLAGSGDPEVKARSAELSEKLAQLEEQIREQAKVRPLTMEERQRVAAGRVVFQICAACHQQNGAGLPNVAPSLVDSHWVVGNPEVLVRIVLNGKEGTPGFPSTMPPIGGALSDDQIAAVLSYIRNSWGLHAGAVTPAQVALSREHNHGRVAAWTDNLLGTLERDLKLIKN